MTSINYFCYLCGYTCAFNNSLEEHYKALNVNDIVKREIYISLFIYEIKNYYNKTVHQLIYKNIYFNQFYKYQSKSEGFYIFFNY